MSTLVGDPNQGLVLSTLIPDDGTTIHAADVNVPFGAIFNNFARLAATGLVALYAYAFDSETFPILVDSFTATSYTSSANMKLDVPGCQVGDVVLVDAFANVAYAEVGAGHLAHLRLSVTQGFGGGTPVTANPAGARLFMSTAGNFTAAFTSHESIGVAGTLRIFVQGKVLNSGDQIDINSAARIRAVHLRKAS